MRDMQTYEINIQHRKRQLRFADNYRLSQIIEIHNKSRFNWRDLFKSFNHRQ